MSNLPPGVSVNDIPGNRPEDELYEQMWNTFYKLWEKSRIAAKWDMSETYDDTIDKDWFINAVDIAYQVGYDNGYDDGVYEVRTENDFS